MTNLDAGAIQEVERLTKEANQILERQVKPGSLHLVRDSGGDVSVFQVPLRNHASSVRDVDSLKALANIHTTAVYVDNDRITLVNEDDDDRWQAALDLPHHPVFTHLLSWRKPTSLTQKELVRLLRTELRGHVDTTLIGKFAGLKFSSNSEVTTQIRPTSNAMDRSIQQRVATENGQDAPESIELHVPVYDIPGARDDQYDVTVYVEYDYDRQSFLLQAVHSDVRAAQEKAVAELIDDLKLDANHRWPVLYGKPS